MPAFEHVYGGQGISPEGQAITFPAGRALQLLGPSLSVVVSVTQEHQNALSLAGTAVPPAVPGMGLIDTGASFTAVDESVCQQLGLKPTGVVRMAHASGSAVRNTYPIQIIFPGTGLPNLFLPSAVSVNLAIGQGPKHIVLIGRDLLLHLRVVYNGPMGRVEIYF